MKELVRIVDGMTLTQNRSTRTGTCPSSTLSTKNPTWIGMKPNPDLRSVRPATSRMSHGTVHLLLLLLLLLLYEVVFPYMLKLTAFIFDETVILQCPLRAPHVRERINRRAISRASSII